MGSSVLQIFCVVSRGGLDEYAVLNLTLEKGDLRLLGRRANNADRL